MVDCDDTIERWAARGELAQPGWYRDPFGRHQVRFWDGDQWTPRVADRTKLGIDPLG